jgi:hypothetical protein
MIKINKQSPPIELLELKNAAIEKNLNADEAYIAIQQINNTNRKI